MKPLIANRLFIALALLIMLTGFDFMANASNSFLWNVASPGANNWNVAANWTPNGVAGAADTNSFGATGTSASSSTINNVVSQSVSISTLLYTNENGVSGQWHVTQIPAGVTLTVTTNLTVGFPASSDTFTSLVAMVDAGTLQVTGNTLTIGNNGSAIPNRFYRSFEIIP